MKIIKKTNQQPSKLNWKTFIVEGNEKTINEYFIINYPENEVSILEFMNNLGTFQVTVIPKEITEINNKLIKIKQKWDRIQVDK
jgi:hypothetical protein